MAKKSRRARRRARSTAQPVRIPKPSQTLSTPAAAKEVNFAEEYHYVLADLKRIGITALVLLILLIALAYLIA
jgi:hypothetical protein